MPRAPANNPANDNSDSGTFGGLLGRILGGNAPAQPEAAYPETKSEQ